MVPIQESDEPLSSKELYERIREWLESPEVRRALQESIERAKQVAGEFAESQRIKDRSILYEPMTI